MSESPTTESQTAALVLAMDIDHWSEWESECNPNGEAFDINTDGASQRLAEYLVSLGYRKGSNA